MKLELSVTLSDVLLTSTVRNIVVDKLAWRHDSDLCQVSRSKETPPEVYACLGSFTALDWKEANPGGLGLTVLLKFTIVTID